MKKYIWLTIYMIGIVWISYTFFYLSKSNEKIKDSNQHFILDDTKKNIDNTWNVVLNKIDKKNLFNIETGIVENYIDNNIKWNTSGNVLNEDQNNTKNIYIGLTYWTLVKDSKYEEIYSILWLDNLPLYKIEKKDIYIKKLESIEYEEEKNNIKQLIQKIWGNIVETNLFWYKQLFVNIDFYYKKESIILVSYDWKTYILIIPYLKYKDYKSYLKDFLFVN